MKVSRMLIFNLFLANFPILYPLKTPENLWFSGVFRGFKMGILARNGVHVFISDSLESLHFLRYNLGLFKMVLTLPVPITDEEKKFNLNFYFLFFNFYFFKEV